VCSWGGQRPNLAPSVTGLALSAMRVGSWRFETHIDQRGDIAECVRSALASLWVTSELHTSLAEQKAVALVVDATDPLLLRLLESA